MADELNFEESLKKLEAIVADLESGGFGLEESLAKFEEGLTLGKRCKAILDKADLKVRKLVGEIEDAFDETGEASEDDDV